MLDELAKNFGAKEFQFSKSDRPAYWVQPASLYPFLESLNQMEDSPEKPKFEGVLGAVIGKDFHLTYVFDRAFIRTKSQAHSKWKSVASIWPLARAQEKAFSTRFQVIFQ